MFEQLIHDSLGQQTGDTESDPLVVATSRGNCGVDSNHPSLQIDQGTATIPGIDRRIRLQKILIDDFRFPQLQFSAPLGTNNPKGDRTT